MERVLLCPFGVLIGTGEGFSVIHGFRLFFHEDLRLDLQVHDCSRAAQFEPGTMLGVAGPWVLQAWLRHGTHVAHSEGAIAMVGFHGYG